MTVSAITDFTAPLSHLVSSLQSSKISIGRVWTSFPSGHVDRRPRTLARVTESRSRLKASDMLRPLLVMLLFRTLYGDRNGKEPVEVQKPSESAPSDGNAWTLVNEAKSSLRPYFRKDSNLCFHSCGVYLISAENVGVGCTITPSDKTGKGARDLKRATASFSVSMPCSIATASVGEFLHSIMLCRDAYDNVDATTDPVTSPCRSSARHMLFAKSNFFEN